METTSKLVSIKTFLIVIFLAFTCKTLGQTPTWNWAKSINTGSTEEATDVTVESATGDVYVVGYWNGGSNLSATFPSGGTNSTNFNATTGGYGGEDGFVAKYNSLGVLQWAFKIGGKDNDRVTAVTVDPSGNIYITGYFEDNSGGAVTATFTGTGVSAGTLSNSDDCTLFFIAKYNSAGEFQWARQSDNTVNNLDHGGRDVTATNLQVFAVGYYNDGVDFGGGINLPDAGTRNQPFIIAYDANGNQQWVAYAEVQNDDYNIKSFDGVITDGTNVFMTGFYDGQAGGGDNDDFILRDQNDVELARVSNANVGNQNIVLISMSIAGGLNWMQQLYSTGIDESYGLTMDASSIYLTGRIGNNTNFPGYASNPVATSGTLDAFVSSHAKSDGSTGWVKKISTAAATEYATSATIDIYNNILLTGYYQSVLSFTGTATTLTAINNEDGYIAAYTNDGQFIYARNIGCTQSEFGYGISSNGLNMVYVAGSYGNCSMDLNGDLSVTTVNTGQANGYVAQIDAVCLTPIGGVAATVDANLCVGDNTTITLIGYLGSIQWQSSPAGLGTWTSIAGETAANLIVSPIASTDYRASVVISGGCAPSYSNVLPITVNPRPTVVLSGTATICNGQSATLSLTLTGTGPWNVTYTDGVTPVTINNILANPYTFNLSPSSSTTYTLTAANDSKCTSIAPDLSGSAAITVNPRPTVIISGNSTVCNGQSATISLNLTGTAPWSITYTDGVTPVTINNILASIYTFLVAPSSTKTYTLSAASDIYCSSIAADRSGSAVVTVNPRPTAVISGTNTICNGQSSTITLNLSGTAPWNVTYTDGTTPTTINNINSSPYTFSVSPITTKTYTVTAANDSKCTSIGADLTGSAVITVNPRPTVLISGTNTICLGQSSTITLNLTGTAPWSVTYTDGITPVTINNINANTYSFSVSPISTKTYFLSAASDSKCVSTPADISGSAVITVNPRPNAVLSGTTTICNGQTASLSVALTGIAPWDITYTDGVTPTTINNINTNPYILAVSPSNTKTYSLTSVSDSRCTSLPIDLSGSATVTVNPRPTVALSGSTTICNGQSATLSLVLTGTAPWSVTYTDGTTPAIINNILLSPHTFTVSPNSSKTYTITAANDSKCSALGIDLTGSAVITVNPRPTAIISGTNTICNGQSSTITLNLTGTPPWNVTYTDGITPVLIFTNLSTYSFNVSPSSTKTYTITALSDLNCTAIAPDMVGSATVTVNPRPTSLISGNATICEGSSALLSIALTGTGPWNISYFDGITTTSVISNTNPYTFAVSPTTTIVYTVTSLSDSKCLALAADMTGSATVTVNPRPTSIISGSTTICNGGNTTLSIALTGTGPWNLTYSDGTAPTTVNGIAASPYNFIVAPSITKSYTVIALSDTKCAALPSNMVGNALVSVTPLATISSQPVDATICEGGSTSYSIDATGQNLNYQWVKNGVNVGINNNVLVLNGITLAENNQTIYCNITSTCGGPLKSNDVKLFVNPKTAITAQPSNAVRCTDGGITFSVVATGVNRTYQWMKGAAVVTDIVGKISGSTTSSLTILNLTASDAGLYSCIITGDCGLAVQSNQAQLSVNDPIVITTQPTSITACAGDNRTFSTVATGTTLMYQWYFDNGGGFVLIPGATNSSYSINNITVANVGTYYCFISSPCGESAITNNVSLAVPTSTSIAVIPVGSTICSGTNYNFSITVVGDLLQYTWYKDGVPLADGGVISNSSTANLSLTNTTQAYQGNYTVRVTGTCGIQTSNPAASLIVKLPISFTTQPSNQTVCSGSDATFNVIVTGDVLGYQWQRDVGLGYVNIAGATGTSYIQTAALAADAGNYRCMITTSNCGTYYSTSASLSINPITAITVQPTPAKNGCVGSNVSFSVTAAGGGLTYQWNKNGASMGVGYINSTINLNNITSAETGSYTCNVTGTCGPTIISLPGILTVSTPTVISNQPQAKSVCVGSNTNLTVSLSAGTNPTYQWYFDDGLGGGFIPIVGGTNQILNIVGFAAANAGDYYVTITNGCGMITSNTARFTLVNSFTITSQPTNTAVCENGTATFTVVASQPGLNYQWRKNGVNIAGATSTSLILNNAPLTDNGANYDCEITNSCGVLVTNLAKLTVIDPIIVVQQPASGVACLGQPFSVTIQVTNSQTPSYQWYKGGVVIAGATNPSYSFAAFAAGDVGSYSCVVSNGCQSITSASASITAGDPIVITNPVLQSLCAGSDAIFTITATGTNLVYEWRKYNIPVVDNGRIIGSNTNSLTINNIAAGDEGTYNVVVTGSCGLAKTSTGAFLDVLIPPVITVAPVPQTICGGQNVNFSVTVTGELPFTYAWQKDGVNINPLVNTTADESTLTINGALAADAGIYRCVITNPCGSISSTSAELIIEPIMSIGSQPVSINRCEGTTAIFSIGITGPSNMILKWYKDGVVLTENARITGVNISTLSINNITSSDEGDYWCEITSMCGNTNSNIAPLSVDDNIFITQQPQSTTVCPNGTLNLNAIATGTITSYQWKLNGVNIPGATNSSYSVTPFIAATHAGDYTCDLTNICGTITSDIAVVTAGSTTSATISGDLTACEGQNASFSVTTTGNSLTYKWYLGAALLADNARIAGSQTATLNITGLLPADAGTYQCEVSGTCGVDNDNTAILTVQGKVGFNIEPTSVSVLLGNTANFTVVALGSVTGYQWMKGATVLTDGADYSGTITASLSVLNAQLADAGDYSCVVTGPCGSITSNSATLTVLTSSSITVQPITPVTLCPGGTISLSITTSGAGHTYQWKKDGLALVDGGGVSGALTSVLNIINVSTVNTGAYTCDVTDLLETSSASIVTVNPSTIISANPIGATKCQGDTHTFTVTATGSSLTYQWYKNAVPIVGAISDNYTITPLAPTDNGNYYCIVTGTCGTKTSGTATLTVNLNTTVNAQPTSSTTICQNSTTSLFFDVTGSALTYLWKKNGAAITDANITGITTSTLQISNGIPTNSGDFTCTITGACGGSITSNLATVTVNPTTAITTQPIGRAKCEGDGVVFTVDATGAALTYDWRRNGVSLGLPSSSSLTINPLVKATHEGTYTCLVSGTCGTVLSNPAVLTVNRNVAIATQPTPATTICQNNSTTLTVVVTGDGLTYLWKKDGVIISAANISGNTTEQLNISNIQPVDAGVYSCTVTGSCGGSLTTNNAVITVNPATTITTQPSNYTRCSGDQVQFIVVATGNALTYQWMKGGPTGTPLVNGVQGSGAIVSGATSNQINITGITSTEAGSYTCVITGSCGNVNSTPALLTVSELIQVTTEPAALTTICQGSSTQIAVVVSGTVTTYKWKKNGNYITDGGNISGTSTNKLILSNTTSAEAGFYSCEISSICNTVNTQSAEIRINPLTSITQQPAGITVCEGDNVQFIVTAVGATPLTYQWRFNNVDIPLATNSTLTINGITPANAGAYTCVATGSSTCGVAISNPANLVVNPKITIGTQPTNLTICEDNTAIISLNATGTAPLTYRWKFNNNPLADNGRITGSTTNELRVNLSTNSDEGIYKCEVSSTCGLFESNSVILDVTDSIKITTNPTSQTLLQGSTATFNVAATGTGLSYQWQKNNANILGATSSSYTIAGILVADAGSYKCIVTGTCGIVSSNIAVLTVNLPVVITTQPTALIRCTNQSASFTVTATGTVVSYQWKFNGANVVDGAGISGSNTSNLVIASVNSLHAGSYSCVVTGSNNTANSNSVLLTVNQLVLITQQPQTQTKCDGDILILEVTPNDPTFTYSWELNTLTLANGGRISGATSSKLVVTGITSADAGTYRSTVSNSCGSITSNPAIVNINPAVSITAQPSNLTQCEAQTAFFSVTANISTVNYQWYKNGLAMASGGTISGATTANLVIANLATSDAGNYSCRVYDNCTYDNSVVAQLTVRSKTIIQSQPVNMTVCEGSVAFFEVKAIPIGLTYLWQKDGVDLADIAGKIEGATTSVLVIRNAALADVGVYRCQITGGCNNEITNPSNLSVNSYPAAAGAVTGIQTVCQGDNNVLYVVPTIANASTYIWDVPYSATIVGGAGTRTVQVKYSNSSLSGVVTVYGQNGCGNGTPSAPLTITVKPIPTANANIDQIICGTSTSFNANPVAGTWSILSGDAIIANPNLFSSSITNIKKGVNEFIWTVTQVGCTARDTVKITNAYVAINAGIDQTICSTSTTLEAITPLTGATWTVVSGSGIIANTSSSTSSVILLAQDVNKFAWQVNNLGCVSRDTVTVNNYRPLQPNAGFNQTVDVDYAMLDANIPEAGTSGFWSLISGSGTFVNINDPKTQVNGLIPGINALVWSVSRQSCILTDTMFIDNILIETPDAGINQTLCTNQTYLDAKYPPVGVGEWSVVSGAATFANKYSNTTKITNIGHGSNTLRWTVRTSGLGMEYDDVTIVNNETSTANAGSDLVICVDAANLTANNTVYGTGVWTLNSGSGIITNIYDPSSLISNLGQGKNDLKWTITNLGCISEDFVSITNNTPSTANAGVDQTICFDTTILYPNTPSIGTGSWSLISGSGIFTGNVVKKLAPDQNTLRYTITQGTCKSTDDILIINNKPTTPNAGYDQNLCINNAILNANPITQGSGVWTTISGSGNFSSLTVNNPTVSGIANGINIYRWTITKNGCSEQDEVIVSNNYVLATAGEDVELCIDNTQLKASNPLPGVGTWSVVGNSGATFDSQNSPNSIVRNLSKSVNTFRWTVNNNGCVSFDDVQVTNNQPTTALAGEDQSVCSKTAYLNANQATFGTGVWSAISGSASFSAPNSNQTTINNLAGGPNVLRWTITKASCVSFDDVIVTSNLPVNVFAGNDQVVCSNLVVLSANPPSIGTGQWAIISGSGAFDNRTLYNTTVRNLGQGDNKFKWTVSSEDCHISDTVVIRSSIPSTSIAGANQILCSETATLGGNTPVNGTGTWAVVSGSADFTNRNQPNTVATNIARGINILAWVIDKDGCQSSSEIEITNNLPSAPYAGYDQSICGDSTRLFANPPTIGTGEWSLVSGDAAILNSNLNQTRVINIKFGDNTFRWKLTNKNCTLYDDVVVTSNYAYVNAGADREVSTPTIQLIGNVPASGTGSWSLSAGQATIQNPNQFDTWVNNLGSGANIFTWSINNNGCIASDEITINYIVMPIPNYNPSVTEGCSPLTVSFVNTSIGGTPYSWDLGDGTTSNETNIVHTYIIPGTYKVILTATASLGQTIKKEGAIIVHDHPKASFDIAPKIIYIPGQRISCFNYSISADTSIWDFGDGHTKTEIAPTYGYTDTGKFDITLKVINSYGCTDSTILEDIIHVKKLSGFFFPEAFTPNTFGGSNGSYNTQDRTNDVFYPIIVYGEITDYELRIYNRSGVLVFKTNDINVGWDGYYRNNLLPQDVYIYMISGRYNSGEKFQKVDNVLLIRKNN